MSEQRNKQINQQLTELHEGLVASIKKLHELHAESEDYEEDNFESTFEVVFSACDSALDPGGSGFGLGE